MNRRKPERNPADRSRPASFLAPLSARYATLAPRERLMVALAVAVVTLALLWWVCLAPALGTLKRTSSERADLEAQWGQMLALQAEAQQLQAKQPPMDAAKRRQALEASVRASFGPAAQLQWLGERAQVTLQGVSGGAIAQWLSRLRADAHLQPVQTRLTRATDQADADKWNGSFQVEVSTP